MSKRFNRSRLGTAVFAALTLTAAGCQEPDQILNGAPPGVDPRSLQKVQEEPSEALGEQAGSSSAAAPKAPVMSDVPPALPTAKGETKTTPSNVKYVPFKTAPGPSPRRASG